jgi:hypothetical protein
MCVCVGGWWRVVVVDDTASMTNTRMAMTMTMTMTMTMMMRVIVQVATTTIIITIIIIMCVHVCVCVWVDSKGWFWNDDECVKGSCACDARGLLARGTLVEIRGVMMTASRRERSVSVVSVDGGRAMALERW